MKEVELSVRFRSKERDFLHIFGVNKGYVISYSKINKCYFLSSQAKQLYHNLLEYAYGEKKECYPSQASLRAELGWSKQTLIKYLDELKERRLIATESQGLGKPLLYYILELHEVPILIHSELVHAIRIELDKGDAFYDALSEYKVSPLCEEVNQAVDPFEYFDRIKEWFANYFTGEVKPEKENINLPKTFHVEDIVREQEPEHKTKEKKAKKPFPSSHPKNPVEEWKTFDFVQYFVYKYREKMGTHYEPTKKDLGCMKRVLNAKVDQKKRIKDAIDVYISRDEFVSKTVAGFSTNFIQSILDQYFNTGKLPSYLNKNNGSDREKKQDKEWVESLKAVYDN